MSDAPQSGRRSVAEDAHVVGSTLGPQGGGPAGKQETPSAGEIAGIATSLVSDIAGTAVEQGRNLLDSAKGQATSFVDERKNGAAQSIADLASTLRDSGNTFEDRPSIQAFVGSAADGLEQLAGGLRDRSFAELYSEVESFARRQPVTVGAAAALAGFFLARFIKSSAEEMAETNAIRTTDAAATRPRTRPRSTGASAARA